MRSWLICTPVNSTRRAASTPNDERKVWLLNYRRRPNKYMGGPLSSCLKRPSHAVPTLTSGRRLYYLQVFAVPCRQLYYLKVISSQATRETNREQQDAETCRPILVADVWTMSSIVSPLRPPATPFPETPLRHPCLGFPSPPEGVLRLPLPAPARPNRLQLLPGGAMWYIVTNVHGVGCGGEGGGCSVLVINTWYCSSPIILQRCFRV